jgi:5-methylcytosine-specific restriction endonuclease McrA
MQMWCSEHGQMSGMHRVRLLSRPDPASIDEQLRDRPRSPRKYQSEVFARDGFRCRYCGTRLVALEILNEFAKRLNSSEFRKGPTNLDTHGIIHAFRPVADHVVPWRLGGRTNPDNLVASCGPCNYGKSSYTVEQMGLENPFRRSPPAEAWDGLRSYLAGLK